MKCFSIDEAYEYNDIACWYQNSIDNTKPPIWTDEHLEELLNDFYIIPKDNTLIVDVVPKSDCDKCAERTTKSINRLQNKINRLERYDEQRDIELHTRLIANTRSEVAKEIFEKIEKILKINKATHCGQKFYYTIIDVYIEELKKKYLSE